METVDVWQHVVVQAGRVDVWLVIFLAFIAAISLHVITNIFFNRLIAKLTTDNVENEPSKVPIYIKISRTIINLLWYVGAIAISLHELGVALFSWNKVSPFIAIIVKALMIILIAQILIRVGYLIINNIFHKDHFEGQEKRVMTLKTLLKSIVSYSISFVAILTMLNLFGVNTSSILATAGVLGLAVGFGAQALVKDVISGFFLIFENQYSVDDHVIINGVEGTVIEVGFRVTRIKGFNGELDIIPNGNITMVTNLSKSNMRAMVDIGISYDSDIDKAISVLSAVADKYNDENSDKITERITVLGVQNLGDFSVDIRLLGFTLPMAQWGVERDLRKLCKEALNQAGISIPFPTYDVNYAGNKGGNE